jgi:hypothetical protein
MPSKNKKAALSTGKGQTRLSFGAPKSEAPSQSTPRDSKADESRPSENGPSSQSKG